MYLMHPTQLLKRRVLIGHFTHTRCPTANYLRHLVCPRHIPALPHVLCLVASQINTQRRQTHGHLTCGNLDQCPELVRIDDAGVFISLDLGVNNEEPGNGREDGHPASQKHERPCDDLAFPGPQLGRR